MSQNKEQIQHNIFPFFPSMLAFDANVTANTNCEDSSENLSSNSSSSSPDDSGCGTSSCDEIDVESIENNSTKTDLKSSFSISNLLKEKSEKKIQPNPFMMNPYAQFYHYNNLFHPLNFLPAAPKIISSITNYQKTFPKTEVDLQSYDFNQSRSESLSGSDGFSDDKSEGSVHKTSKKHVSIKDENGHHSCDVCGKKFKHIRMLNRHRRNHNPYKKYKCNFCGKGFNDSFDLKRHVRTHTGVKPYNCNQCEKSFTQRCSLESHMDKIHGVKHDFTYKQRREKIYVCEDCGHSTHDVREHYKHSRDLHHQPYHQGLPMQSGVSPLNLLEPSSFVLTH